jgi:hypothetical protein
MRPSPRVRVRDFLLPANTKKSSPSGQKSNRFLAHKKAPDFTEVVYHPGYNPRVRTSPIAAEALGLLEPRAFVLGCVIRLNPWLDAHGEASASIESEHIGYGLSTGGSGPDLCLAARNTSCLVSSRAFNCAASSEIFLWFCSVWICWQSSATRSLYSSGVNVAPPRQRPNL